MSQILGAVDLQLDGGCVIVKNTFLEFDKTPGSALVRRVCSDPALYERAAAQSCACGAAEPSEDGFDLTGLSDAETASVAASAQSSPSDPSSRQSEPRGAAAAGGDKAEALDTSGLSDAETEPDAPWLPPSASASPGRSAHAQLSGLVTENERLQVENELLKESMMQAAAFEQYQWMAGPNIMAPAGMMSADAMCYWPGAVLPTSMYPAQGHYDARRGSRSRKAGKEDAPVAEAATTVILRNVPNNYTRAMLLEMLDTEGFGGTYDLVYLPIDFNSRASLGYAFVNLVTADMVPGFWSHFDGFKRWTLPTKKVCSVGWAGPHQGLHAHIERYRNSPVMHESVPDEFKPVLFKDGVRIEFPSPAARPRMPRVRQRDAPAPQSRQRRTAAAA